MLFVFTPSKRNWAIASLWVLAGFTTPAQAGPLIQTNLVSNVPGLATINDPLLINPGLFA